MIIAIVFSIIISAIWIYLAIAIVLGFLDTEKKTIKQNFIYKIDKLINFDGALKIILVALFFLIMGWCNFQVWNDNVFNYVEEKEWLGDCTADYYFFGDIDEDCFKSDYDPR